MSSSPHDSRPNVLFVFSDEHRACSLPGEPYCDVQTIHLQRLAHEGTSFGNCISNYPVCSPYRAMLLSGRWPFLTGVVDNSMRLRDEGSSLGEAFRAAGYRTGYIGKWHLSPRAEFIAAGEGRHGFDHWQAWFRHRTHLRQITFDPETGERISTQGYSCTLMTDAAIDFINAQAKRPWMLVLSWVPPHPPFDQAPRETTSLYDRGTLQIRPNVPEHAKPEAVGYLQGYYAHISALDAELGRLLHTLDQTGQTGNTIVVYTSDHGTMLGSHGTMGKRLPHDESCRVPFLVRYPGIVPAGLNTDVFLNAIDIFPSLCGLAGIAVPPHCDGLDISGAMRGSPGKSSESAFLMHVQKANAYEGGRGELAPLFRGVRTDRFTYAVAEDGRWCLYDDCEDPYQMRNLIGEPSYANTADDLDALIAEWLMRAHDPFPFDAARNKLSSYAGENRLGRG